VRPTIAAISVTPVKGFQLLHPESVELTENGVVENRRFFLVDGDGKRLRSSLTAWPIAVAGRYDAARERLWMRFPDGTEIEESALGDGSLTVDVYGRDVAVRAVPGAWDSQLSELAGHPVRVVRPNELGQVHEAPVTLVSCASVERLGEEAGGPVDARRFRMLFDLDGCEAHEEDGWDGRHVEVGGAILRVGGGVGRCAATTRHPETGKRDLDTLRLIAGYRERMESGELPFGVYAWIERPGRVAVGDELRVL